MIVKSFHLFLNWNVYGFSIWYQLFSFQQKENKWLARRYPRCFAFNFFEAIVTTAWHSVQMVSRFKQQQKIRFVWLVVPFSFSMNTLFFACVCVCVNHSLSFFTHSHSQHQLFICVYRSGAMSYTQNTKVNALPFCDIVAYVCYSDESIGKSIRSRSHSWTKKNWRKHQQKRGICKRLQMRTSIQLCVWVCVAFAHIYA